MHALRRLAIIGTLLLAMASVVVVAPGAGADDPPDSSTTTTTETTIEPSTTSTDSTLDPSSTSTDPTSVDSTDTTAVDPNTPPNYATDDDLVGRGFYASQGAFDPSSKSGLAAEVARAQKVKIAADLQAGQATAELAAAQQDFDTFQAEMAQLATDEQQAIKEATAAKIAFEQRAVAAYMGGREAQSFALLSSASPNEYANRNVLLSAVLDRDVAVAADYEHKRDALTSDLQARVDRVDEVTQRLDSAKAIQFATALTSQAADWQVKTFRNNSHLFVPGFIFPVAGPVQFVDSFGAPRLVGTGQQHWHEGCDVMSPMGTPLVAVEDGTVIKVGENSLGGLSLRIAGVSGYWYYYAHLSAFAPDLKEGMPIRAGTLVGYVGNTGDAAGGPTHLHFEVHQKDGKVLDAFGLLKTSWQARQLALQLGGTDPVSPPEASTHPDPGTPGGFPRYPDGRAIYLDAKAQVVADAAAFAAGVVFAPPPPPTGPVVPQ